MFEPAIAAQVRRLTTEQGRRFDKILFWLLLLYLEVWAFQCIARDLLAGIAISTFIAAVLRRTALGRRSSFLVLHGAVLVSLVCAAVTSPLRVVLIADAGLLATLVAVELANSSRLTLLLIGVEHVLGLLLSPWSPAFAIQTSAIGAHVVARSFAVVLVLSILLRARFDKDNAPPYKPPEPQKPPRRPLTVAEWEKRPTRDRKRTVWYPPRP